MDRVYLSFRADIVEMMYSTVKYCLLLVYKSGIRGGRICMCISMMFRKTVIKLTPKYMSHVMKKPFFCGLSAPDAQPGFCQTKSDTPKTGIPFTRLW